MTGTRQALVVLVASLSFLPGRVLPARAQQHEGMHGQASTSLSGRVSPALAQSTQIGQTQNAIGMLVVVRPDGIEDRVQGKGALQLFEGDVLRTEAASQALIEFRGGIRVALGENTTLKILSRWEKAKGITPIVRLKEGEILVSMDQGSKPLEVETPVAVAAARETEFDVKVSENGESVVTVVRGNVEFGTTFGSCSVGPSTASYGARGRRCTPPAATDVKPVTAWIEALLN